MKERSAKGFTLERGLKIKLQHSYSHLQYRPHRKSVKPVATATQVTFLGHQVKRSYPRKAEVSRITAAAHTAPMYLAFLIQRGLLATGLHRAHVQTLL